MVAVHIFWKLLRPTGGSASVLATDTRSLLLRVQLQLLQPVPVLCLSRVPCKARETPAVPRSTLSQTQGTETAD